MTEKKPPSSIPVMSRLMRLFFRLLYHPFAWTYDLVASTVSLGRWQRWIHSAATLLAGPRVLELGFGPGHLQAHLNASGLDPFGLDESAQMARQAAHRQKSKGFPARLVRGLAQRLPYPSQTFDSVVATFPTLYIVDPDTLSEIMRVLKPGGRLVVLMVAWLTGRSLQERMMQRLFRVTSQVPPDDWDIQQAIEPYVQAGFQASLRFMEPPGSRLLFILAVKPKRPV